MLLCEIDDSPSVPPPAADDSSFARRMVRKMRAVGFFRNAGKSAAAATSAVAATPPADPLLRLFALQSAEGWFEEGYGEILQGAGLDLSATAMEIEAGLNGEMAIGASAESKRILATLVVMFGFRRLFADRRAVWRRRRQGPEVAPLRSLHPSTNRESMRCWRCLPWESSSRSALRSRYVVKKEGKNALRYKRSTTRRCEFRLHLRAVRIFCTLACPGFVPARCTSGRRLVRGFRGLGRLQAFEKLLYQPPLGLWLDEFASEDEFIIPEGRIFSVDADLWTSILDVRPAHVVGGSRCCEAGEGTPFLLAWQTEREFLLRELTYEEARRLKEFCLACKTERADAAIQEARLVAAQSQLGLF